VKTLLKNKIATRNTGIAEHHKGSKAGMIAKHFIYEPPYRHLFACTIILYQISRDKNDHGLSPLPSANWWT